LIDLHVQGRKQGLIAPLAGLLGFYLHEAGIGYEDGTQRRSLIVGHGATSLRHPRRGGEENEKQQ
jgi:hypothetical protein